jgi:hypothetical protein
MRTIAIALALVLLALSLRWVPAAEVPDLTRVDRAIKKEPAYVAKNPLYGLALFGRKAEKRVWLVLDRSKPDAPTYDVLHIDRNADGDLTGPGERIKAAGGLFKLGEFTDPATGAKHSEFTVRVSGTEPTVMLSLRWRGKVKFGGGYPEDPEAGYLRFAARPKDAPVVWVHGDAPFRFQRWYGGKLSIGGSDDFKVFLGQPGRGPSTFAAAQVHFLPAGEFVLATLVYRDAMGKEKRLVCELKERC